LPRSNSKTPFYKLFPSPICQGISQSAHFVGKIETFTYTHRPEQAEVAENERSSLIHFSRSQFGKCTAVEEMPPPFKAEMVFADISGSVGDKLRSSLF
jgi:hypothetical protein